MQPGGPDWAFGRGGEDDNSIFKLLDQVQRGLGVNARDGDSQHFGAPLFQACQEAT